MKINCLFFFLDHNNLSFFNNSSTAHSSPSEKYIKYKNSSKLKAISEIIHGCNEIFSENPDIKVPDHLSKGIIVLNDKVNPSSNIILNDQLMPYSNSIVNNQLISSSNSINNTAPCSSIINLPGNYGASNNALQQYLHRHKNDIEKSNISWQKLLTPPPKQMVLIERINSGARRFVVLDFGSPILLTDLVIPSCDELASMYIDIWCINEDVDSIRLVTSTDISTKTLILSDLQPPPICRFMKITIIGRLGMSATKCKIPLGSFYGHTVILDTECYGDPCKSFQPF